MGRPSRIRLAGHHIVLSVLIVVAGGSGAACGDGTSLPSSPSAGATAPSVSTVSPSGGSTIGGTALTIGGAGFQAGATVSVGGAATNVTVLSSTSITAITPAQTAGTVDIVVTNPGGLSGRLPGAYTYSCPLAAPTGLRTTSATTGGRVLLFILWDAVPTATSYVFEVGTRPGQTVFTQEVAPAPSGAGSTVIGAGTNSIDLVRGTSYFIRVKAKNACGVGPSSVEIQRDYV